MTAGSEDFLFGNKYILKTYIDTIEKQKFRRNGGLDTNHLVEAIQNERNVFVQSAIVKQQVNDPSIALRCATAARFWAS